MTDFLSGAMFVMCLVIALFQLRFWKKSHDRLFLFFAASFVLMAVNRIALTFVNSENESLTGLYLVRLASFVLILVGIWDKNRSAR